MALFAIADLHLSFASEKPMDIFCGWNDHALRLEKNWRRIVNGDDTVVIPGDISWAMSLEEALGDLRFIDSLPGKKIIFKGNHDYWWATKKKMEVFFAQRGITTLSILKNNSFLVDGVSVCGTRSWGFAGDEIEDERIIARELGRLKASLESAQNDNIVVFLHYPPIYNDFEFTELTELMKQYGVKRCYYGHLHGHSIKNAFIGTRDGIDYRLISADHLEFVPYKLP